MELQARVQVGEKGRIVIPAEIREAMGIRRGRLDGDAFRRLRIAGFDEAGSAEAGAGKSAATDTRGVSLADELIAERREAASA